VRRAFSSGNFAPLGSSNRRTSTVAKAKSRSRKSQAGDSVYRITEIVGTSPLSWEDAVKTAVATASSSLRDLRIADIVKLDVKLDGGRVVAYRARVALSFKYEA
jgi:flavin-binding protein dodecin